MEDIYENRDDYGIVLSKIINKSNKISDVNVFLDNVLDVLVDNMGLKGGTICLSENLGDEEIIISHNIDDEVIKSIPYTKEKYSTIVYEDLELYKLSPNTSEDKNRFTSIPIVVKNNIHGFILLESFDEFTLQYMDKDLLETIGQSIGIAIEKVRLENKLKEDRILLEETLNYNKKISEYFANLSHELRTPLNIIMNIFPLIEKEVKSKKFIRIAKQNSYRLLRLINNIIDISKMEANFFEMNFKNHNIVNVVEDITQSIADYIKLKDINITFDTDIEEKIIACDPYMIERVILNLLSNSIKSIECDGRIYVSIKDLGDMVELSVRDNGIGIPEDKLEEIFDRFSQIDVNSLKNIQSSGIGLSLVKSIIELHRGKISVKSKVNKGTEFIMKLPVYEVDEENNNYRKSDISDERIERISVELADIYGINNESN